MRKATDLHNFAVADASTCLTTFFCRIVVALGLCRRLEMQTVLMERKLIMHDGVTLACARRARVWTSSENCDALSTSFLYFLLNL
jgi:hypothetical protein